MKRILNVLIIVAILTSCDNVNKKATSDSTVVKPDIELIDNKEYLFNLDDFTVSSNYLFELEIKKDTINSYKYLDEVNNTFYRINVVDNRKASSLLTDESNSGIIDVVKEFQSNFLEEYKRNLKLNKQSYKEVLFNNRKAIKVNIILTNDNLIKTKQGFTNALMLVFLNGFKSYTLTVISSPDIIEEQFNMFIDSFKLTKDKNQNIYISKKYNMNIR